MRHQHAGGAHAEPGFATGQDVHSSNGSGGKDGGGVLASLTSVLGENIEDLATLVFSTILVVLLITSMSFDAALFANVRNERARQEFVLESSALLSRLGAEVTNGTQELLLLLLQRHGGGHGDLVEELRHATLAAMDATAKAGQKLQAVTFSERSETAVRATLQAIDRLRGLQQAAVSRVEVSPALAQVAASYVVASRALMADQLEAFDHAANSFVQPAQLQLGIMCLGASADGVGGALSLLGSPTGQWSLREYVRFIGRRGAVEGAVHYECYSRLLHSLGLREPLVLHSDLVATSPEIQPISDDAAATRSGADAALQQIVAVATTVAHMQKYLIDSAKVELRSDRHRTVVMVVVSVLAAAASIVALAFFAFQLIKKHTNATSLSDIRQRFRRLEARAKLLPRYRNVLATGSVREPELELRAAHSDTFLTQIIDFVLLVRPYLPQTAFGDIEHVSVTGSKFATRTMASAEASSADQAIKELLLRDLRLETGMQLVSGSVLFISLDRFSLGGARSAGAASAASAAAVCADACELVGACERIVNGNSGVIASVAGDAITALWNVTSSTPNPQYRSVASAVALSEVPLLSKLEMGVACSPMIAGNVITDSRHALYVVGPGAALAERFALLGRLVGSSLVMDAQTAEAIASADVCDGEYCVRPAVISAPFKNAPHEEPVLGHAFFRYRVRAVRAKAWAATFRDFAPEYVAKHYGACFELIHRFFATIEGGGVGGGGASNHLGAAPSPSPALGNSSSALNPAAGTPISNVRSGGRGTKADALASAWLGILKRKMEQSERKPSEVPQI